VSVTNFFFSPSNQAFIVEDEEQTRSLPPNPFNGLTERVLEEYKSLVERKQLGQEGRPAVSVPIAKPQSAPLLLGGTANLYLM